MENYIEGISIDWSLIPEDSYLRTIGSLKHLEKLSFAKPVTFFVGENGSGKSTLLEAIAVAYGFNAEGGTVNYHFSTKDTHSPLHEALFLEKGLRRARWGYFLRAESFYNVATAEEEYMQDRSGHYHEKSHGESFLSVLERNFQGNGLYLLDEPEAALSPQRQLSLLAEIHRYSEEGAQFFITSHSPILLGLPGAEILSFDEGGIHPISYEETESYRITKNFLENPERMLRFLLED